jgi:hypothetical protein
MFVERNCIKVTFCLTKWNLFDEITIHFILKTDSFLKMYQSCILFESFTSNLIFCTTKLHQSIQFAQKLLRSNILFDKVNILIDNKMTFCLKKQAICSENCIKFDILFDKVASLFSSSFDSKAHAHHNKQPLLARTRESIFFFESHRYSAK